MEDNKRIIQAVVEEGYNKNNLSIIEETHAQDFVVKWLFAGSEPERGPQAAAAIITRLRRALPDMRTTVDGLIGEGDIVALQWTIEGTHRGDYESPALGTLRATGNRVRFQGVNMIRLSHGKIVEQTIAYDRLSMSRQLGGNPSK